MFLVLEEDQCFYFKDYFYIMTMFFQLTYGPTIMPQAELLHPEAADVLEILIIIAHILGLVVNLLLGEKTFRAGKSQREVS